MLRVIEYFAKSLKVIRNDTLDHACVSPYWCFIVSIFTSF